MNRRMPLLVSALVLAIAGALIGAAQPREAASQLPNAAPSIADLGWMAGTWVREETGGQYLEEVWTAPVNNSLTGMFRWNRGGKPWMCELMTRFAATQTANGATAKPNRTRQSALT